MLGQVGHSYMSWAASMAVGLDTGVPWIMCKEDDAPDPVVSVLQCFVVFILFLVCSNEPYYFVEFLVPYDLL